MTSAASIVDGKTINGLGSLSITALHSTLQANLSQIMNTSVAASFAGTGSFNGFLGKSVVTVSGSGVMTIEETTNMGTALFVIENGSTLSAPASLMTGKTSSGLGITYITGLHNTPNADLSSLTTTSVGASFVGTGSFNGFLGKSVVTVSGSGVMTIEETTNMGTALFVIENRCTLSAPASLMTGKTTSGLGLTSITGLHNTLNADLSSLNTPSVDASFAGTGSFVGSLGKSTVTVSESGRMTLAGAGPIIPAHFIVESGSILYGSSIILSGVTAFGDGQTQVTSLQSNLTANLSLLETTSVLTQINSGTSTVFNGNLGKAILYITDASSVTFGPSVRFGPPFMGYSPSFDISPGSSLESSATLLSGITSSGDGVLTITGLDDKLNADLSTLLTQTVIAYFDTSATFTGNLGKATVAVRNSSVMTLDASVVVGTANFVPQLGSDVSGSSSKLSSVISSGAGTITITQMDDVSTDLSLLLSSSVFITISSSITFTGKLSSKAIVTVDNSAILTLNTGYVHPLANFVVESGSELIADTQIKLIVSGTGTTRLSLTNTVPNLFDIISNTVILTVRSIITLDTSSNLGKANVVVENGYSLTMDPTTTFIANNGEKASFDIGSLSTVSALGSQISGLTTSGLGTVIVSNDSFTADFSTLTNSAITVYWDIISGVFTGDFGNASVNVRSGNTLTLTAALATGKNISGSGIVNITELNNTTDADLSNITASTVTASWSSGTGNFSGDLGKAIVTISGSSRMTIFPSATTGTSSFVVESGSTLAATDTSMVGLSVTGLGDMDFSLTSGTFDFSNIQNANTTATLINDIIFIGSFVTTSNLSVVVGAGRFLTVSASIISGVNVSGNGTVNITSIENKLDADFSTIITNTVSAVYNFNNSSLFTGNFGKSVFTVSLGTLSIALVAILGTATFIVDSGALLSGYASQLSGKFISGSGSVSVQRLGYKLDGDFSNITTAIATSVMANSLIFTGNLGPLSITLNSGIEVTILPSGSIGTPNFTILSGSNLIIDASILSGIVTNGAGDTTVTALHSTLDADLTSLLTTNVFASFAGTNTFTGSLGKSIVTVSGSNTMTLDGVTMGTSSFVVESGSNLSAPASLLTGFASSGAGDTTVTALHSTLDADLTSLLTTNVFASFAGTNTFTGSLGKSIVTVSGSNTMTLDGVTMGTSSFIVESVCNLTAAASLLDGVFVSGAGSTTLNALHLAPSADLRNITTTASIVANVASDTTFSGFFGTTTVTISSGATLITTSSKASGKSFHGTGNIEISDLHNNLVGDFSNVFVSGTKTAYFNATDTFTGNLGSMAIVVGSGFTMTTDGSILDAIEVNGGGSVHITNMHNSLTADFSNVNPDGTITGSFDGDGEFVGAFGNVVTAIGNTFTMTVTAARMNNKTITGDGSIFVTNYESSPSAILTNVNVSGIAVINVTGDIEFGLLVNLGIFSVVIANGATANFSAFTVNGKTISGAGSLIIRSVFSTLDSDFSNISITGATALLNQDGTFIGNLGTGIELIVGSGATLTIDASIASGKTISGGGNIIVSNLNNTPAADLSNITCASVVANIVSDVTFTGSFGEAVVNVSNSSTITLSGATMGTSSFVVESGSILTGSASLLTTKLVSGAGTTNVTELAENLLADLSGIATTIVNAEFTGGSPGTFNGSLGKSIVNVTGNSDMTLSITTNMGVATFVVDLNSSLNGPASLLSGVSTSGLGATTITSLELVSAADLSGLLTTLVTAFVGGDVTFTGNFGKALVNVVNPNSITIDASAVMGTSSFVVQSSAEIIAPVTLLSGKTASGDGTITINDLQNKADADLSNLTVTNLNVSITTGLFSFTGNLGNAQLTVVSGSITVSSATFGNSPSFVFISGSISGLSSQFNGKTASGTGEINMSDLEDAPSADFSNLLNSTVTTIASSSLTFNGNFGKALVNIRQGQTILTLANTTVMGTASFDIQAASSKLVASAALLNGVSVIRHGTTEITDLHNTLNADLSGIVNTTVIAAFDGTGIFTGDLGRAVTTIGDGFILTTTAAIADAKILLGAGSVSITDLEDALSADLSGAVTSGGVEATFTSNGTFRGLLGQASVTVSNSSTMTLSGTFMGTATFTVDSGSVLNGPAFLLSGVNISGGGSVAVTDLHDTLDANFTTILIGNLTAAFDGIGIFTGILNGAVVTIGSGGLMTVDGAKITNAVVNGTGDILVTNLGLTNNLSGITNSGTRSATISSAGEFTGNVGNFEVTVTGNITVIFTGILGSSGSFVIGSSNTSFIVNAAIIDGKTTSGSGRTIITDLQNSLSTDLSNLGTTTVQIYSNNDGAINFTGTLPYSCEVLFQGTNGILELYGGSQVENKSFINFGGSGNIVRVFVSQSENTDFSTTTGDVDFQLKFTATTVFSGSLDVGTSGLITISINDGFTLTSTASIFSGRSVIGQTANIVVNELNNSTSADLSNLNVSAGTVSIYFSADGTFMGYLKSASQTIDLYVDDGVTMTLSESSLREVLTYTDSYGSANKTTGRRPNKLVTKRGNGTIILDDVTNENRRVSIGFSGGQITATIIDVDLINQINSDGRNAGDFVASGLQFVYIMSDGTSQINSGTTLSL